VLDKAEYSAFESTSNSPIVSYRTDIYWRVQFSRRYSVQRHSVDDPDRPLPGSASEGIRFPQFRR